MEEKNKKEELNEEIRIDPAENVSAQVREKSKASGLGGLVSAGGRIKKSAAKKIAKII